MEIKIDDNSARIIPVDKIDVTNSEKLKKEGKKLIDKDIKNLILDLKKVNELDSSAIGRILFLIKITKDENIKLIIENVNSNYVEKVFNMLDLGEVVEIKDL